MKTRKKDTFYTGIRKKLGVTQVELAVMLGVSRSLLSLSESGKRNLRSASNILLAEMFSQFQELETGRQLSYRSLETNLVLNDSYKEVLPQMKEMEKYCRLKIKLLKKDLEAMKERAKNAEHSIIVFTTAINKVTEDTEAIDKDGQNKLLKRLNHFKGQAYEKLIASWEPEQAKLHGKIEAIAGEAKALRRYRVKVMKEYKPI